MAKIYEVRYKKEGEIVAHQHFTERGAKADVMAQSRSFGTAQLAEMDKETNMLSRVCEFVGGTQGKWENRTGAPKAVRILLTVEDTKIDEEKTTLTSTRELTNEEKEEKRAALARLREQNSKKEKETKTGTSKSSSASTEKKDILLGKGYSKELVECILCAGLHEGSPNFNALVALWEGNKVDHLTNKDFGDAKALNKVMTNLRATLMSKETGKSIQTSGGAKDLKYRLVDFKLEVFEDA